MAAKEGLGQLTTGLVLEKLHTWYAGIVSNLPNFAVAILIIVVAFLLSRLVRKATHRILRRSLRNQALTSLFSTISQVVVIALGLFIALGVLHLDKTVTSLLAGAGVIGIALGFAFQDLAANFMSGIMLAFKEPFKIGDIIEVEGIMGEVKDIDLRTSLIETFQGVEIYVPNNYMFTKPLQNYSGHPIRRLDLEVGVSYADNLRKVEKILKETLVKLEGRIEDREIEVFFKEFGSSSINCDIRIWVHYPRNLNYLRVRHNAVILIKEAFDENEITIPFPIRTLDFGIKGGENLSAPLRKTFQTQETTDRH